MEADTRNTKHPALSRSVTFVPLLLATAVALALRLVCVDLREAWLDEAFTSVLAQAASLDELLAKVAADSHPPLYYVFMRGWVKLFGAGEVALRMPSLIAGVALVPLCWQAVRVFGGSRLAAAVGAWMTALSPLAIYYAVEARSYAILWLLALAVLVLLRQTVETRSKTRWWIAALLTAIALYTHHYGVFLLPLWLLAVIAASSKEERQRGGIAFGVVLLVWLPWVAGFLFDQAGSGGAAWIERFWDGPGTALFGSARTMALANPFPGHLGELGQLSLPGGLAISVALVTVPPLVWGIVVLLRGGSERRELAARLLPVALLLGPTLGAALVSLVKPIYLVGRYDLMAYPAWILLWSVGVGALVRERRVWVQVAVLLAALAAPLPSTYAYLSHPRGEWNARESARFLAERPAEELVVVVGDYRAPLEHQLRNLGDHHELASFPPDLSAHPGWWEPSKYATDELFSWATSVATAPYRSVWLVLPLSHKKNGRIGPADDHIVQPLFVAMHQSARTLASQQNFGSWGLMRFEAPGEPSPDPSETEEEDEKNYRCSEAVGTWVAGCEHDKDLKLQAVYCTPELFVIEIHGLRDVPLKVEISPPDGEGVELVANGAGIQVAKPPEYHVVPSEQERRLLLPLFAACARKNAPPMNHLVTP